MSRKTYRRHESLGPRIVEATDLPIKVYSNGQAVSSRSREYTIGELNLHFSCIYMDDAQLQRVEHSGLTRHEGRQATYSTVHISSSSFFYWPRRLKQLEPPVPWPEFEDFLTLMYDRLSREYSWHERQKGTTSGVGVMELYVDWDHDMELMDIFRCPTMLWLAVWLHAFKVMADRYSRDATAQCRLIFRRYGKTVMLANTDPEGYVSVSWQMWPDQRIIPKIEDMDAFYVQVFTSAWPTRR